jgi:hypothetical protein
MKVIKLLKKYRKLQEGGTMPQQGQAGIPMVSALYGSANVQPIYWGDPYATPQKTTKDKGETATSKGKMELPTLEVKGLPNANALIYRQYEKLTNQMLEGFTENKDFHTTPEYLRLQRDVNKLFEYKSRAEDIAAEHKATTDNVRTKHLGGELAVFGDNQVAVKSEDGAVKLVSMFQAPEYGRILTTNEVLQEIKDNPQFAFNSDLLGELGSTYSDKEFKTHLQSYFAGLGYEGKVTFDDLSGNMDVKLKDATNLQNIQQAQKALKEEVLGSTTLLKTVNRRFANSFLRDPASYQALQGTVLAYLKANKQVDETAQLSNPAVAKLVQDNLGTYYNAHLQNFIFNEGLERLKVTGDVSANNLGGATGADPGKGTVEVGNLAVTVTKGLGETTVENLPLVVAGKDGLQQKDLSIVTAGIKLTDDQLKNSETVAVEDAPPKVNAAPANHPVLRKLVNTAGLSKSAKVVGTDISFEELVYGYHGGAVHPESFRIGASPIGWDNQNNTFDYTVSATELTKRLKAFEQEFVEHQKTYTLTEAESYKKKLALLTKNGLNIPVFFDVVVPLDIPFGNYPKGQIQDPKEAKKVYKNIAEENNMTPEQVEILYRLSPMLDNPDMQLTGSMKQHFSVLGNSGSDWYSSTEYAIAKNKTLKNLIPDFMGIGNNVNSYIANGGALMVTFAAPLTQNYSDLQTVHTPKATVTAK